ncbi:ABC transporter ATP-binding protein [Goodfellowiella coeruleoviolacea]
MSVDCDDRDDPDRPVISVSGVCLVREGRTLLEDVDLAVRPGQHWALLGANGAGKTTLLRILGAHQHPTRGSARILGRLLGRVDIRELRVEIGHVDPRHPVRSALSVREVVLTGCTGTVELMPRWRPDADQLKLAADYLELVGLGHRAEALWPVLSQGERTRTLIARALMPAPRLLLLDEPTTGLDLAAREQLLDSVDRLRQEYPRLASVLVTHHLEELPASTTHAMLLREGRTVAAGPVEQVLTSGHVSDAFRYPVTLHRTDGRWHATAGRRRSR